MTGKIEVKTIRLVRADGSHIRKATRIIIDGYPIDFTEKLTRKQVARYIADRTHQQRQALIHAEAESYGG